MSEDVAFVVDKTFFFGNDGWVCVDSPVSGSDLRVMISGKT